MWSCAPDPVDSISSTSDNGAGSSSDPFPSGPEDGVKPCNLLPYMPADDREVLVLQQLQDIRLSGDVDEQSTSEWDLLQKTSGVTREMPFHLLKEITDGFSNERKLGRGSYGVVYMGVPKCGPKIAVKMLHDMPGFDEEQFLNEFTNLERLDHPNIVRLLGYCYDIQKECHEFKGKIVVAEKICRVLCLEYMHYGSLDKYLSDEGLGLKWNICYKIIKGICKGLKYLHEESKPPVFHLDLKPANILLDENMQPKIADFGLSRFFGEEKTWITKNFVGTPGYVPPEFIERNLISNKFDIFSLGVVIIKIMTGRKGYIRSAEMSPQEFVELALKNWRTKIPKGKYLFIPYSEQVKKCMEIALSCVDADRQKRPTIGDIVKQLKIETDQDGETISKQVRRQGMSTTEDGETIPKEVRRQGMSTTDVRRVRRQGMSTTEYEVHRLVGSRYELGRTIGEGTFRKVRFARDMLTGMPVAIKILDKEKVLKHKMVEQINREIWAMKLIKHPNVLRIHEVMGSKRKIYIVLEFATGGDLFDTIVNHGRMREDVARRYFQQLINAIDYCHSRGVYHRDLKPENLLLDLHGNLKVSDFWQSALSQHVKDDGLLHTVCGTPNYLAPEVLEDEGYDGSKADLWSCGVILFFMLAGYLPFEDSNLMALYMKISNAEFTFPPWTSFPAKRLLTRILDPNIMTRITIHEILEDEWFKEGYKRPEFDEKYGMSLDDVDAFFNDSEEHHITEKKEPVALNAFELISMSADLGNLFNLGQEFKTETRFTSKCPPKEIVCKIEEAAKPLGFDVQKKNYKLRLENVRAGRIGKLNVAIEILQVAPSLHMVEVRLAKGDTLEFLKFYKNLFETLKDVIWKSDDLQTQHAS